MIEMGRRVLGGILVISQRELGNGRCELWLHPSTEIKDAHTTVRESIHMKYRMNPFVYLFVVAKV